MFIVILLLGILGAAICLASVDDVRSKLVQLGLGGGAIISLIAATMGSILLSGIGE